MKENDTEMETKETKKERRNEREMEKKETKIAKIVAQWDRRA